MSTRRRGVRFQPSGKLVRQPEPAEEITPPDQLQRIVHDDQSFDSFPDLKSLFTAPIDDLRHLIRNRSELAALEMISNQIIRLYDLIRTLSSLLQPHPVVPEGTPHSSAGSGESAENIDPLRQTMNEIAECLSELAFQKRSITQYQEMNSCLGEELIERNCPQLAKEKQILAQVETLLAKRLDSLFFTGPPYRTFSTSWKDILQSQQHNSAPQSPEIPQEDDRLSHSPRDYDSDSMVQSPGSEESDDELSSRTKALVRSTQETLIAFDSSESSGNSLSSPSPSSHDLRRTSSEISPHPAHKRIRNEDSWPLSKRRRSHSFNETLSPEQPFSPKPIRLTPLSKD